MDRRAEANVGIQIVPVQIQRHEHISQPFPTGGFHHIFLLGYIVAGFAAGKAIPEILPGFAVQLHAVKAQTRDYLHGSIKKRPVVKSRAIEITKPYGKKRFADFFGHDHSPHQNRKSSPCNFKIASMK